MTTVSPTVPSTPTFSFAAAPKRNDRFYAAITHGEYACMTFVLVDHEAPTFQDPSGQPTNKVTLVTKALSAPEKAEFRRQMNSLISSIQRSETPTSILTKMKALCTFGSAMLADRQEPYRKPGEPRSGATSNTPPIAATTSDFTPDWEKSPTVNTTA